MSRFELKPKVHALRRSGKSILEISRLVGISKSTSSLWCRDVELTPLQRNNLKEKMIRDGHAGRLKGAQVNRDKRIMALKGAAVWAKNIIGSLSKRDRLVAGVALYWAEGSKAMTTTGFVFVNSDPSMIMFMYEWITDVIGVEKEDIFVQISINEIHRYRIDDVLKFWSSLLDLPPDRFAKTSFAKSVQKKVYDNHNKHYGMLRLSVRRSTLLKYRVLKMIEIIKAGVAQVVRANAS